MAFERLNAFYEKQRKEEVVRFCESEWRDKSFNLLYTWMRDPLDLSHASAFKVVCVKLQQDVSHRAIMYVLQVLQMTDETKFLLSMRFLLDHCDNEEIDQDILCSVIRQCNIFANQSVSNRLALFQNQIPQAIFSRFPTLTHEGARYACGDVFDTLNQPYTKDRLKEIENYDFIKKAMKKQKPLEKKILNRKKYHYEAVMKERKEMREASDNAVVCTGCGKKEGMKKFKVCSKCKLAFFCSQKCFKKNWKIKHKADCKKAAVIVDID